MFGCGGGILRLCEVLEGKPGAERTKAVKEAKVVKDVKMFNLRVLGVCNICNKFMSSYYPYPLIGAFSAWIKVIVR